MTLSEALRAGRRRCSAPTRPAARPASSPRPSSRWRCSTGSGRGARSGGSPAQLLERLLSTDDPTRDAPPADDGARRALGPRRHDQPADPAPCRPGRPTRVNTPGGRRIFGIENEYGVTCSTGASARSRPTRWPATCSARSSRGAARATCSSPTARGSTSTSARTPSTPPPSATTSRQLVAHDKAGERILEGLVVDAQQRLREDGMAGEIYVFKNNTDSAGNSYGCHENYLVTPGGRVRRRSPTCCMPFLISRQIICGAGKVVATSKGATYCREPAGRPHLGGRVAARPPAPGRSSTPATSRTPTPSTTAGCTSSSATRT